MSQFDETIARIVIDLDRSVEYDVKRTDTALRISFPNPSPDLKAVGN